ncbi:MAG: iron export ABC transporter permease subunit FetB [Candidatus Hydrogenedentes bacterium]|nr:iron export ABC transporter permease subunit FetB [Candidatus Hydrogenedentota bacterium]
MNGGPIPLDATQLAIAACLVAVAGVVSLGLRLGLERRLALASVRTVVQLLLIGYVLKWVFEHSSSMTLLLAMALMMIAASRAAVARPSRTFSGATGRAFGTLVLCGLATTFSVTELVIGVEPWYEPRYVIPLLGMVLGNALTGISLSMDHMLERLAEQGTVVEMELAHGATRWEAARDVLRDATRRGLIPIVNTMMVVGIVSLPGMMTGQILAGADPLLAVKYQIVVMFMIAAATSLACILMVLLVYGRLFNAKHQLLANEIIRKKGTLQ